MADLHVYAAQTSDPAAFTSIQAAIDAAATGDTIYVHAGGYDENLVIRTDGITLIAVDGPDSTFVSPKDATLDTVEIAGADHVTVTGFTFAGGTDDTKQTVHVHAVDSGTDFATHVTIDGNTIERGAGDGIKLSKVSDVTVTDNQISGGGPSESGVDLVGGIRVTIVGNSFANLGYVGISLKGGSSDIIVADNTLTDTAHVAVEIGGYTSLNHYMPGFVDAGNTYEIANVLVSGNTVQDAGNAAFRVIGGQGVWFTGNTATGTGAVVKIDDSAKYHDTWYSDNIGFSDNAFDEANWLIDRSDQALIVYDSEASGVFTPWGDESARLTSVNVIEGTNGDDDIAGEDGADEIFAYGGDDEVAAGAGDDVVYGAAGEDRIRGEGGADLLYGDGARDTLEGGAGQDTLFGGDDRDQLRGDDGADLLDGGDGRDRLEGGKGDDTLIAGADDDRLKGGDGNDVLFAGADATQMEGGKDADSFVFILSDVVTKARIRDFDSGEGDLIVFEGGGTALDEFSDLDTNGNGLLDNGDDRVETSGDRTTIDLSDLYGGSAGEHVIVVEGSTLRADCFLFDWA